ncbi:MAG TPA: NADH-quinone oxidoreductase subunit NuoB [Mycobacteriales bacterium]|nr:NADH-quinone oxidoreductase subunit NuoB [Mycobacteriales bacterium]
MTAPQPTDLLLEGGPRLVMFDLGLACCAVEFVAAAVDPDGFAGLAGQAPSLSGANVLVVSGTLTDVSVPAVVAAYERLAEPRYVVSFGACANTGGPYWDSYSVTKGVDQLLPVDVYVPGCPPRPDTLLGALRLLEARSGGVPT